MSTTCICSVCALPLCTDTGNQLREDNDGGKGVPQPGPSVAINIGDAGRPQPVVIALRCGHVIHEQCFQIRNLQNAVLKCPQCLVTVPRNAKLLPLYLVGDPTTNRKNELEAANKREAEVREQYEARLREMAAKCEANEKTAETAYRDYQDLKLDYERKTALIVVLSFQHEENQQKLQKQTNELEEMKTVIQAIEKENKRPRTTTSTMDPSCALGEKDSAAEPSPKRSKDV